MLCKKRGEQAMMKYVNGVCVPQTEEDFEPLFEIKLSYKERIVNRIRERYSINDEIAILRQKDMKPEEYQEYNAFVEQIKAEERDVV